MNSGTQGPASLLGQSVGGYRLTSMLGRGATGAVFLGQRREDTPRVIERTQALPIELPDEAAIKVLILPWQLEERERADFHARFIREAQTLQRLRHPAIVSVLDYGDDPAAGFTYMTLPYMAGGTLAARMAGRSGPLPLADIASNLSQIAAALDYAHSQGVVHRDIKPANLLLDDQGQAYVSDFSIVRVLVETHSRLTSTGRVMGTPEYMAPEQIDGRDIGPAADIYGLGMVAYALTTGDVAFSAPTIVQLIHRIANEAPPPPRTLRPDLPEPAEAAILRALAKDPAQRFPTAEAFAHAFAQGLQGIWVDVPTAYITPGALPTQPAPTTDAAAAQTLPNAAYTPTQPAPGAPMSAPQPTSAPQRRHLAGPLGVAGALLLIVACVVGSVFAVPGSPLRAMLTAHPPTSGATAQANTAATQTTTPTGGQTPTTRATATPKKGSGSSGKSSGASAGTTPGITQAPGVAPSPSPTQQTLHDGATFVTQSVYPTVNPGVNVPIYFVLSNSGTTTWSSGAGYVLVCTATCLGGQNQGLSQSVGPTQQYQFNISLTAPVADYGQTYRTWWVMAHNGQQFGPAMYIDVTVRGWHSWYSVHRPACDDSGAWSDVNKAATRDCSSSSGLVLSQYSNTNWAELDLNTPNGQQYYSQNNLRLRVQGSFLNPSDTSVWATVVDQTPQGGACGGYLLAVNSQGYWKLQLTSSACGISTLQSGQIGGFNAGSFSMEVDVLNGSLSAVIDGQTVVSGRSDSLNPSPGAEGLMEESSVATSSAILFHDFELDSWS